MFTMSFSQFALSPKMIKALEKMGYFEPSPVQKAVIPKALRGSSLLAQSETGSGKTHAYLIPTIERIDCHLDRLQAIIIAPTRELARQTFDFARAFENFFPGLKVRLFSSESDVSQNIEGEKVPPQLVIGTPGRLKSLLVDKGLFSLQNTKTLILDEADMLLELGYFSDIEALLNRLNNPQIMVFSATLKENLKSELKKFVQADFSFEGEKTETAATVRHHLVDIKHQPLGDALVEFLASRHPYLCLAFASKKETVDALYESLKSHGVEALYFTGSLNDRARKKALREIQGGRVSVIVASDILARGMDIPDVTDVVSVDLPSELEFYAHRAGRTGRFGKDGDSWVFYDDDTTARPLELLASGVPFDYYELRKGVLSVDPVGLAPKRKLQKKTPFLNEDERKEISIAKAKHRGKQVKPAYKKKRQWAIEKVKRKYRRKAIQKAIRREIREANQKVPGSGDSR
jgi:ATP-dependent RNA helicase CshB